MANKIIPAEAQLMLTKAAMRGALEFIVQYRITSGVRESSLVNAAVAALENTLKSCGETRETEAIRARWADYETTLDQIVLMGSSFYGGGSSDGTDA